MYEFKNNMTFFGPAMTTRLVQNVPEDELEIQMERRDIYKCIVAYAEECGVKFEFENAVSGIRQYAADIVMKHHFIRLPGNRFIAGINTTPGMS